MMLHIANTSSDKTHPKTTKEETIKRNDNPRAQPSPAQHWVFKPKRVRMAVMTIMPKQISTERGKKEHQWLPVFCKK